jgi:hypothetical protein
MVPLDYILAVALLTAPIERSALPALPEHVCLMPTLREVVRGWELLDPREGKYVLVQPDDLVADVCLLQGRYQELMDAPPVSDAQRFPCREAVCEMLTFNRAYHRNLAARRDALGSGMGDLDCTLDETDQLYRLWDLVRDARSECYYISVRRAALLALKRTLGPDDYNRGVMPPHVPVWRFRKQD